MKYTLFTIFHHLLMMLRNSAMFWTVRKLDLHKSVAALMLNI